MKKLWLVLAAVLLLPFAAVSQESQEAELVRYEGFAIGAYFQNSYSLGKWAEHVNSSVGGGVSGEYTFIQFPIFDLGFSARLEIDALIPQSNGLIKSATDFTLLPGAYLRIPFSAGKFSANFVPEFAYGLVIHNVTGVDKTDISGLYTDQVCLIAAGLRLTIPKLEQLEVELSPLCMFDFEQEHVIFQAGFRIGALWHLKK